MNMKASLVGALFVFGLRVAGKRNESGRKLFILLEDAGDLISVHIRQTDVEDNNVRMELPGFLYGVSAVVGNADLVAAKLQEPPERVGSNFIIINNQNSLDIFDVVYLSTA